MLNAIRKGTVFLLFFAAISPAWSSVGEITGQSGVTWLERSTVRSTPNTSELLKVGDTLGTGQRSEMLFKLTDGAEFKMHPNTILRIDEFDYDPSQAKGQGKGKIVITLIQGSISVVSGQIGSVDPANFVIITPSGVINAMQGEFRVSILNESMPSGLQVDGADVGTYITVEGGIVIFTNDAGTELLEPGDTVFVPNLTTLPSTPTVIPPGVDIDFGDGDVLSPPDSGIPDPETPIGSTPNPSLPTPSASPAPSSGPQPSLPPAPSGSPNPSGSPQPSASPDPSPSESPMPSTSPTPSEEPNPSTSPSPTPTVTPPDPSPSPDPSMSPS